jgi:hypothetical protein
MHKKDGIWNMTKKMIDYSTMVSSSKYEETSVWGKTSSRGSTLAPCALLLNTKPSDFRDFAKRLHKMKSPSVAVVSLKSAFESAAKSGKVMELKEIM